jgi:pyruvate formate lyase activating enzyme
MYPDYVGALLASLKANEIHVALETSGYFDYATFVTKILPYTDLAYYDIKFADSEKHLKYTGKPGQRILDNFRRLVREKRIEVHPRVPLIPGITSSKENLAEIVEFLCDSGAKDVSLLPYNPTGFPMAECLGKPKPSLPEKFMEPQEEDEIYQRLKNMIKAYALSK